jgi:peptidoglycan-associated lipoprotein
MKGRVMLAVLLMVSVVVSACSKRQPETAPAQSNPGTMTRSDGGDREGPANDDAARRSAEEMARRRAALEAMVFFAYDQSDLSREAQAVLNEKVPLLRETPAIRIRVEGHADERGSLEYNLALGRRRAQSVRDFLTGFGLNASRFEIESFGEDRPLDAGHSESAWSRNRRAAFVVLSGM